MSALDWIVLLASLGSIVGYGLWKTRARVDMAGYLHGGYRGDWRTIGLSVMATQASAGMRSCRRRVRPSRTACASCSSTSGCRSR